MNVILSAVILSASIQAVARRIPVQSDADEAVARPSPTARSFGPDSAGRALRMTGR